MNIANRLSVILLIFFITNPFFITQISCADILLTTEDKILYAMHLLCTASRNTQLEPCGCQTPQVGGLDREAILIDSLRKSRETCLLLDVGGFTQEEMTEQAKLRGKHLLKGLHAIGFDAINICRDDEQLLASLLTDTFDNNNFSPLLSANLVDNDLGDLCYSPWRILDYSLPDGKRIKVGIVGLSYDDSYHGLKPAKDRWKEGLVKPENEHLATDIVKAARSALSELNGKCDLKIAIGLLDERSVDRLTREVPGFDLVIFNPPPPQSKNTQKVRMMNGTYTVKTGSYLGRYVAKITLECDKEAGIIDIKATRLKVLTNAEKKPEITKILDEYKVEVAKWYIDQVKNLPPSQVKSYVGAEACNLCHPDKYLSWKNMAHANALETLVANKQENNPECLKCHTVGFNIDNGFRTIDQHRALGGVQCESCHGPSWEHASLRMQEKVAKMKGEEGRANLIIPKHKPISIETCTQCHQPPHDDDFDFERAKVLLKHQVISDQTAKQRFIRRDKK